MVTFVELVEGPCLYLVLGLAYVLLQVGGSSVQPGLGSFSLIVNKIYFYLINYKPIFEIRY